jgi:hypothetical protein
MRITKLCSLLLLSLSLQSFANYDILRTMDRPQLTEKPHTLGLGLFQIEGTALQYSYEKSGKYWAHDLKLFPVTAKYGIAEKVDLSLSVEPFEHLKSRNSHSKNGFGETRLGGEYTFWENQEFNSAISAAPFVKFPTNTGGLSNNAVEFGVKAPFTMELEHEFTFGAMLELDVFEDIDGKGYHIELVNSVSITRPIFDSAALYGEYYSRNSFEDFAPWNSQLGMGGIFALNDKALLDASIRWGLTEAAYDFQFLAGGTYRF